MPGSGSTLIDLMSVQVGTESGGWGTAVTPTAKLMGVQNLSFDPGVMAEVFHDRRGSLAPGYLSALTTIDPAAPLEILSTYEDTCYLLDNLCGQASPSGTGPYTRNYSGALTSVPSPRILTWVYGDATNCHKLAGGLISKLVAKGENGKPMMINCDLIGKDVTAGSLAALSDRTVNVCMGDHMALYIDAWGGTIGSTQISTTAYAYELTIDAKRKVDHYLGSLAGQAYHEDDGAEGWDVMLKLSLEFNAAVAAQYTALISQSAVYQKQVRLKSSSSTNVLQFDIAGTSEKSPVFGSDRDGVLTFDVELRGTYNSGLGNYFKAQSLNSVSTLA